MNEYLAGMIARGEHEQRNQALCPVRDFDVRGQENEPGWAAVQIGHLFQAVGSSLTALGERLSHEETITSETQLSNNV
jgi:hypothetical protein